MGVVDTIYALSVIAGTPCMVATDFGEMANQLSLLFMATPDEELQRVSGSAAVLKAFGATEASEACFGAPGP